MQEIKFINTPKIELNSAFNRYENIMGNDYILVDWMIGNTCNYGCTYCHPKIYDGSNPWPEVDIAFEFVKRTTDHYRSIGKNKIVWNLLGGEPTVWSKFSEFFHRVKDYDPDCIIRVLTNGSRTLRWWEKNANLFDEVIISWHPERADYVHCTDVSNILQDSGVFCSIQVCMYPPLMDHCIEAAKYFHENTRCTGVSAKSLQENLLADRTFDYDQEKVDQVVKYSGMPKAHVMDNNEDKEKEHQSNLFKMNRPAYGKTMRFLNTYTGMQEFVQANELMASGRNSWEGWMCNIGIETLHIDDRGKVSSGSSCFYWLEHGNINDPENIEFPTTGRVCEFEWCSCIADVEVTKYRVE